MGRVSGKADSPTLFEMPPRLPRPKRAAARIRCKACDELRDAGLRCQDCGLVMHPECCQLTAKYCRGCWEPNRDPDDPILAECNW